MRRLISESMRIATAVMITCVLVVAVGCVDTESPYKGPLVPLVAGGRARLVRTVSVKVPGFSAKKLPAGMTWRHAGSIADGQVYKPVDAVLFVDNGGYIGGRRFEADLVVREAKIVGLYLPTEKKFLAAVNPIADSLTEVPQ